MELTNYNLQSSIAQMSMTLVVVLEHARHKFKRKMLTLKYQGKQRGPQFYFQVESSVNFLSKDLVAIAYRSSSSLENFSSIADQTLNSFKYVVGTAFTSFSQTKYTMMAVSFTDPDVSILFHQLLWDIK